MNILRQLGAASWGFRDLPLKDRLTICKRLGMQYLEVGIANAAGDIPLEAEQQELEELKQLYREYDISYALAATGNDFTLPDQEELQKQIEKVIKVIDICAKLEVKYLRIFAGFFPVEEITGNRWEDMISSIVRVAEHARQKKVTLAIETHGGVNSYDDGVVHFSSVSTDTATLKRMMEELPRDVKFVFDLANLYAVGSAHPEEVYKMMKERIAYLHLKDFALIPSGHLLPAACGESDMDWNAFMTEISDFTGPMLIEYENVEDVEEGSAKSIQFLKQF